MAKTKKEMFAELREMVIDNEEMVAFIDHEIELLERKKSGSRKPTKTQIENEAFKAEILATLKREDKPLSIKELCEVCEPISGLTNQRITHMLTALHKAKKITRELVKKTPYFSFNAEGEVETVTD